MVEERYAAAAKTFDQVESQHPYSVWATKSQMMAAYAQYEAGNYGEAVIAADRFIQLHPGHRDVAYAYYLKAISYYVQIVDVGRDQKMTEQALKALDDVVRRFPDSKYARDAKLKLDFTRDHLAGKEMEIGRYYLKRGAIPGGDEPFQTGGRQLSDDDACARGVGTTCRVRLGAGLDEEAKANAAVLGYNYPGSEWYQDGYALVTGNRQPWRTEGRLVRP